MKIARAIERVKRQAKRGGLQAVMAGLGEELRSHQLPAPLRGAAERIATLLEGGRGVATPAVSASPLSSVPDEAPRNGHGDHADVTGAASNTNAVPEPGEVARVAALSVGPVPRVPSADVSLTGSDSGAEPGPVEPEASTPVDPLAVGATPEVIASPIEVEPVDASPTEVAAIDASPIEVEPIVSPVELPAPSTAPSTAQRDAAAGATAPKGKGARSHARKGGSDAPPAADGNPKEGLAESGEAAKNLARSGSRGAKRRSSSRGNTSKKK